MLRLSAALLAPAFALATACGGASQPAGAPAAPAPAPAAPPATASAVGTATFTVTAAPDRVLPAIAWYPAQRPGAGAPPLLGRKLPVVAMSHGLNGRKEHASFLAERIAAAGYLVAAVDHLNDGAALALQRPLDIAKLLDRLGEHGEHGEPAWLGDLADLEHVAVYGHSFGGYTALALAGAKMGPNPEWTAYCTPNPAALGCPAPPAGTMPMVALRDPRVDVAVAVTPAGYFQFGRVGTAAIETPVLLLAAGKDQITPTPEFVRPLFQHIARPRWYVELELAGHMTFVDLCAKVDKLPPPYNAEVRAQCAPDAPLPLGTAHALIGELVVATLDHLLKGAPAPDLAGLAKARGVAARVDAAR